MPAECLEAAPILREIVERSSNPCVLERLFQDALEAAQEPVSAEVAVSVIDKFLGVLVRQLDQHGGQPTADVSQAKGRRRTKTGPSQREQGADSATEGCGAFPYTHGETLFTLADAAKLFPDQPNSSTIWRWHTKGVRGVRLETTVIAGRRFTTREAIDRFVAATTAVANKQPVPIRSVAQQIRDIERAEREVGLTSGK
jgi:hypothetical protein